MKISIVISYYNRRYLLINTLRSIIFFNYDNSNLEIIIVNDGSSEEEKISDLPILFPELNIKIIEISNKEKKWINPCIPFNIGFYESSGDIIIIQNPECLHLFDLVKYVEENINKNKYMIFSCFSEEKNKTNDICNLTYDNKTYIENIKNIVNVDIKKNYRTGERCWYQHSIYKNRDLHFCSAIMKLDLDELGGFDERFHNGIGKDDKEFILRMKRKGMDIIRIDSLFVIHQFHLPTKNRKDVDIKEKKKINENLFKKVKKEKTYYSLINDYYRGFFKNGKKT